MALHANEEADAEVFKEDDNLETSPLAFTVHFDDPKPEGRKLKIHDKLSSFALKHRRNPSLPDFKPVRTTKSLESADPVPVNVITPKVNKGFVLPKAGYHSEGYFSSDQDEESIKMKNRHASLQRTKISPVTEDKSFVPHVNGASLSMKQKQLLNLRRNSLNDIEIHNLSKLKQSPVLSTTKSNCNFEQDLEDECDKSDTVSEAGTYTVNKDGSVNENNDPDEDVNEDDLECPRTVRKGFLPENHQWINDWVKKVAEENLMHPPKEPPLHQQVLSGSGSSSASASKIPSPVNTMPKIKEPVNIKRIDRNSQPKVNGTHHKRSSSLNSKDFSDHVVSDGSLETESYLRTTESVMTAMQNRLKTNLKLNLTGDSSKKSSGGRKERIHPPSTASDTDTNSENDSKDLKKLPGTPFTSARLNRAFSLRRARADLDAENVEKNVKKRTSIPPVPVLEKRVTNVRLAPSPQPKAKPAVAAPFSRTDCGRFSMRSTHTVAAKVSPSAGPKKDKKPGAGGRSNSSLSSKEVEFQNWKRRKSFDPMKAAAEGRKKEAAKKAAMTQSLTHTGLSPSASMTQSVNLGTTVQTRSGNPVLRSASFHVSPLQTGGHIDIDDELSAEEEEDIGSTESPCFSRQPTLPPNSPTRVVARASSLLHSAVSGSRGSLNSAVSESHSSPSRRARAEFIDNLLISTIADLSIKLKFKSSHLLNKLGACCEGENYISFDGPRGSVNNSPTRKHNPRDFPAILKNLKAVEGVLQALDDTIFGEDHYNDD